MSSKDIEKQIAKLQAQLEKEKAKEAEAMKEKELAEARVLVTKLVETLEKLNEIGYMPKAVIDGIGDRSIRMAIRAPRKPK